MAGAHSWENRPNEPIEDRRHAWENRDLAGDDPGFRSGSDDDLEDIPESSAADEFVRFMITLLMSSTLSATMFAQIMYYAARAGIKEATKYGLRPGQTSSNYSRKVKSSLGWSERTYFYNLELPGHSKHDVERTPQKLVVIPGFEQMDLDVGSSPTDRELLRERKRNSGGLPPSYYNHPIVQGAGEHELVYPIAIYMDGVPYSHTDSVIGFWLINLLSGMRYLISVLRKRIICQCGCRGWCTISSMLWFLRWDVGALAAGRRPGERHDRSAWLPSDSERSEKAGRPMIKAALMYIKGDWMEFASTMGFPTWQDNLRPCFDCNCFGTTNLLAGNMYDVTGISLEQLTWSINEEQDYYEACDRCEIKATLRNKRDADEIEQFLRYDKREHGCRGRGLVRDLRINNVELLKDDRLEPSESLMDIGCLDQIVNFPVVVIFWRMSAETLTRHRNPLLDRAIGITPKRTLTVDVLHAFFLGILNIWCRISIWQLISSGSYGDVGNQGENVRMAVLVIRAALLNWYRQYEQDHPGETLTRVADLTPKMLGTQNDPKMKTKGAETWGVALFLIDELRVRAETAGEHGNTLRMAGGSLEKIVRIWKRNDWTMPRQDAQEKALATIKFGPQGPRELGQSPLAPLAPFPWPIPSPWTLSPDFFLLASLALVPFPLASFPWPLVPSWPLVPGPFCIWSHVLSPRKHLNI